MASWDDIRKQIFATESGGDYNALYGYQNRPGGLFDDVRITDMTVDDALDFSNPKGRYGAFVSTQTPDNRVATPMGAYQVVGSTLRDAKRGLGLKGSERMTPELQDRIGKWIYDTQGAGAWEGLKGTADMENQDDKMRGGILGGLSSLINPQNDAELNRAGAVADALALGFNSMRLNPDPNVAQFVKMNRQARQQRATRNRTLDYLREMNTPQAIEALRYAEGTGDIAGALKMAIGTQRDDRTALIKNYEYARQSGYEGTFQDFLKSGGGGNTVVNVGGQDTQIKGDYVVRPDPESEAGVRFVPIPGTKAAMAAQGEEQRKSQLRQQQEQKESTVSGSIDYLIGKLDKGGIFNLPEAGIRGNLLARLGVNQEAVDFANELSTVQANIAFDRLQQMREASRTGGALGGVSERELDLLMNAYGNIAQSTSPERLKQNLQTIKEIMGKIENDPVARSYYYGGTAPAVGAQNSGTQVGEPY